jgi:hypothetical protein
VAAYINMVCDQLRNSLPKAAVHCQVREAKRSLLDHFYTEVGKREVTMLSTHIAVCDRSHSHMAISNLFKCTVMFVQFSDVPSTSAGKATVYHVGRGPCSDGTQSPAIQAA